MSIYYHIKRDNETNCLWINWVVLRADRIHPFQESGLFTLRIVPEE